MNPFRRLLDFITNPSNSRTVGVLVVLIIALAVPLTVQIAQKQQELRQHAAENCNTSATCSDMTIWSYPTDPACPQGAGYHHAMCGGDDYGCFNTPIVPCPAQAPPQTGAITGTLCLSPTDPRIAQCTQSPSFGIFCPSGQNYYTCSGTTPAPTPISTITPTTTDCDRNGGKCMDQATYQANLKEGAIGTITGDACWTGDQVCFKLSAASGTGGGSTGTPVATCDASKVSSEWNYTCGCTNQETGKPGWKAVCLKNPSQDTTCYPGNPPRADCTNTTAGPPGAGTGLACDSGSATCTPSPLVAVKWTDNKFYCQDPSTKLFVAGTVTCSTGTLTTTACNTTNCSVAAGNICQNNQCVPIPNQIACSTKPTCPSGYSIYGPFPSSKWACLNGSTNTYDTAPTCGTATPANQAGNTTTLSFVIGLDGIGTFGDSKGGINRSSNTSNKNPVRSTGRNVTVQLFNSSNDTLAASSNGTLTYNGAGSGTFSTAVAFSNLATGVYKIRVKPDGYLRRNVTGATQDTSGVANPISITAGQSQTLGLPSIIFVTGDIDNNNQLNIADYNLLLPCMFKSASGGCQNMDLDDNGIVDQFDYNLFIREFGSVQSGD